MDKILELSLKDLIEAAKKEKFSPTEILRAYTYKVCSSFEILAFCDNVLYFKRGLSFLYEPGILRMSTTPTQDTHVLVRLLSL